MNRNSYLDAGEDLVPPANVQLVTNLALVGISVPLVSFGAWRYAVNELNAIDEGTVQAERRAGQRAQREEHRDRQVRRPRRKRLQLPGNRRRAHAW